MLTQILEGHDLTGLHTLAALFGVLVAIHLMQLSWHSVEDQQDAPWVRWLHRFGLAFTAMTMLWSVNYAEVKHWQPWPADVFIIIAVDLALAIRALTLHLRGFEHSKAMAQFNPFTHRVRAKR